MQNYKFTNVIQKDNELFLDGYYCSMEFGMLDKANLDEKAVEGEIDKFISRHLSYSCLIDDSPKFKEGFAEYKHYFVSAKDFVLKAPMTYNLALFYIHQLFNDTSFLEYALNLFKQKYKCLNPANYSVVQFKFMPISRNDIDKTLIDIKLTADGTRLDTDAQSHSMFTVLFFDFLIDAGLISETACYVKKYQKSKSCVDVQLSLGELFYEHPYAYTGIRHDLTIEFGCYNPYVDVFEKFNEKYGKYSPFKYLSTDC